MLVGTGGNAGGQSAASVLQGLASGDIAVSHTWRLFVKYRFTISDWSLCVWLLFLQGIACCSFNRIFDQRHWVGNLEREIGEEMIVLFVDSSALWSRIKRLRMPLFSQVGWSLSPSFLSVLFCSHSLLHCHHLHHGRHHASNWIHISANLSQSVRRKFQMRERKKWQRKMYLSLSSRGSQAIRRASEHVCWPSQFDFSNFPSYHGHLWDPDHWYRGRRYRFWLLRDVSLKWCLFWRSL